MKFEPGDVVFIMHNDNTLSKIIAKFMKSKWSHSAVVIGHLNGEPVLCETSDLQTGFNMLDRYIVGPECDVRVYRRKLSKVQKLKVFENAKKQNGIPYGWFQLLSFAIRRIILNTFGKRINNFIRQGQVCCATVGYCLQGLGGFELSKLDPESYDTQELEDMMEKNGFKIVFEKFTK